MRFFQVVLATTALATSTAAWSMHFMNNAYDLTKTGDQPCTDFEKDGKKNEIKKGDKYSWTSDDKKEPGLKKCCAFVYPDTGCRGGHALIEHKGPQSGLGSLCKSSTQENKGGEIRSYKVECKSRPL